MNALVAKPSGAVCGAGPVRKYAKETPPSQVVLMMLARSARSLLKRKHPPSLCTLNWTSQFGGRSTLRSEILGGLAAPSRAPRTSRSVGKRTTMRKSRRAARQRSSPESDNWRYKATVILNRKTKARNTHTAHKQTKGKSLHIRPIPHTHRFRSYRRETSVPLSFRALNSSLRSRRGLLRACCLYYGFTVLTLRVPYL